MCTSWSSPPKWTSFDLKFLVWALTHSTSYHIPHDCRLRERLSCSVASVCAEKWHVVGLKTARCLACPRSFFAEFLPDVLGTERFSRSSERARSRNSWLIAWVFFFIHHIYFNSNHVEIYLEVSYHIISILLSGRFEEEFPIFPVIQGLGPMACWSQEKA
jgi:hypothetical protein